MDINKGTFYRSVAGMWHKTPEAAGGVVTCIKVDGVSFHSINKDVNAQDQGLISFEQEIKQGSMKGTFGIQMAKDGRIWICIDGQSVIRFKPL